MKFIERIEDELNEALKKVGAEETALITFSDRPELSNFQTNKVDRQIYNQTKFRSILNHYPSHPNLPHEDYRQNQLPLPSSLPQPSSLQHKQHE